MNIQNSLYLRDKSFRFDQCNTCQLFIRISQKSFSFAICDTADKQVHALYQSGSLKSAEEIMDELNRESGYFTQNFETVKIIIETFSFTFIPESLYSEASMPVYENMLSNNHSSKLAVSSISGAGIKTVFKTLESLISPLLSKFPNARIFTQADALICAALSAYPSVKKLVIQINEASFELSLTEGGSLIFYNIFEIETADDFNYYLLLLIRQLSLSRELPVAVSGIIGKDSEIYHRIKKYFDQIEFADSNTLVAFADDLTNIPPHQFFSLLSLSVCE